MNIQTDPRRIKDVVPSFPAVAEQPIRATVLHEDRLRATGESLARRELRSYHGLEAFDFHARVRESAKKILQVYRDTNAAQGRGEPITPAAQWLLGKFSEVGFSDVHLAETADGSQAVVGSRPGSAADAPTVLLYSHYDVQPPLNESAWRTPPFQLTEVDGRWYGRGAADCRNHPDGSRRPR